MTTVMPDEGLRARKQRETRDAIHRAAVSRATASGPESVTVADISADANVSTRTFFNYFPSKDGAILGFHGDLPTDEDLARFVLDGTDDMLHDVVMLMRDVFASSHNSHELAQERRELVRRHPQLMQRQMSRVYAIEQRIAAVVAERMRASRARSPLPDIDAAARMLVMLATTTVRFTIRHTGTDRTTHEHGDEQELEAALTTLREVIRTLP